MELSISTNENQGKSIIAILTNKSQGKPIRDQVVSYLNSLPEKKRLQGVLALLDEASEKDEHVAEFVWEVWDYLMVRKLWRCQYSTLKALKEAICYEDTVETFLQKHRSLTARKEIEAITVWRLASLVEPMVLLAETRPIGRVSSATSPLNITGPVNFVPTYSYG
jgi:hypothetical protein